MGAWGVPAVIITIVTIVFILMQVIGEIIEFKGKVAPEFMKVRKYFKRKKLEKQEKTQLLKTIAEKFSGFEKHYSPENIDKRNQWMDWVEERAVKYDESIERLTANQQAITDALNKNTLVTNKMFIQNCRTIIINFSEKAGDYNNVVTREEFNRVFNVYEEYEEFLAENNMTNGEVDIAIEVIREAYAHRLRNHSFFEDTHA